MPVPEKAGGVVSSHQLEMKGLAGEKDTVGLAPAWGIVGGGDVILVSLKYVRSGNDIPTQPRLAGDVVFRKSQGLGSCINHNPEFARLRK
jgi:hypothetical protein